MTALRRRSSRRTRRPATRPSTSATTALGALLRLRPRVPDPRRRRGRLQGALQPRRHPDGAVGLRGRRPVRPHREEAVLPRRARVAGLQLRHAGLRPPLRVLPELGHLAGAARSRRGLDASPRRARSTLVRAAVRSGARSVVSTYNEPLITTEWAVEVFKAARAAGLLTGYVSNGNGTPEVLEYLAPWIDLVQSRSEGLRRPAVPELRRAPASPCSTRSAGCTRWASGSRSSRSSFPASTTRTRNSESSPRSSPACRPTSRGTSRRSIRTTG